MKLSIILLDWSVREYFQALHFLKKHFVIHPKVQSRSSHINQMVMKNIHNRNVTVITRNPLAVNGSTLYIADICNCLFKFGFDVTVVCLQQPDSICQKINLFLPVIKWRIPEYCQFRQYLISVNFRRWIYLLRCWFSKNFTNHFSFLVRLRDYRNRITKNFSHENKKISCTVKQDPFSYSEDETAWVSKTIYKIAPRYLIFDFINTIPLLNSLQNLKDVKKICISHDVFHLRPSSAIHKIQVNACVSKEEEIAYFNKMDAVLVIQDDEASYLRSCDLKASVFSLPFTTLAFSDNVSKTRHPVRHRLLFIGNDSDHNAVGLKWFIQQIFPLLQKKASDYTLFCCGSVCNTISTSELGPGIFLCGIVKDLSKLYLSSSCSIVPLLFGSGLKTKLMESLANNCPVVSTSIGVQGIQNPERYGIAVADQPQELANAIHLATEKKELTPEEKSAYEQDFSPENIYHSLLYYMKQ